MSKKKKFLIFTVSLILVFLLGILDYFSGSEISFSIFYLIPITMAAYYLNFNYAFFISVISTVSWFLADIYDGHNNHHTYIPIWNALVRFFYFTLHSYFFSQFIKLLNKIRVESLTDSLTKAYNSRFFYQALEGEIKKAEEDNRSLALVYLDLDNFKKVNDEFGHKTGDELLFLFSQMVQNNIRPEDIFARLGGDEFALILSESDKDIIQTILNRISDTIVKEMNRNNWPVTLSIGGILFKRFHMNSAEMIKAADDLMYTVKKSGKNNIEFKVID